MSSPKLPSHLLLCLLLLPVSTVHADCERTPSLNPKDHNAAIKLPFGRINLTHRTLQPEGTPLASIVVPSTSYTYDGATADTVLWTCDKTDVSPDLYFLVSTNGDSRYGGHNEIGGDGSGIYATWFKRLGLRLTMEGVVLSRRWKIVPLQTYAEDKENGKIHIRVQDVPPLQAELYRVNQEPPSGGGRFGCSTNAAPSPTGTPYTCREPNAYIQLHGPIIKHDEAGDDHATKYLFWGAYNGIAYTLTGAATLSNTPTCAVHSATPHVRFATTHVQQLQDWTEIPAGFSIVVDCDHAAESGINDHQTAIGLQVSPGAFAAAQRPELRLVNDRHGVEYLLSDQYGDDPGLARGVGIRLYGPEGDVRKFVGHPGTVGKGLGHPWGAEAGWYPVAQGASPVGGASDGQRLQLNFSARLVRLPGHDVTPGKVHATAHVLVKVQ